MSGSDFRLHSLNAYSHLLSPACEMSIGGNPLSREEYENMPYIPYYGLLMVLGKTRKLASAMPVH